MASIVIVTETDGKWSSHLLMKRDKKYVK